MRPCEGVVGVGGNAMRGQIFLLIRSVEGKIIGNFTAKRLHRCPRLKPDKYKLFSRPLLEGVELNSEPDGSRGFTGRLRGPNTGVNKENSIIYLELKKGT